MPELPEVETIKRVLEPQLKSLKISDITTNRTDIIAYPSADCKQPLWNIESAAISIKKTIAAFGWVHLPF